MTRPTPPITLLESLDPMFVPAFGLVSWVKETFIDAGGLLTNPDHEHLQQADIAFIWTNVENVKRRRLILGQCQLMPPGGDKWTSTRSGGQIIEWFGGMPDALITIYAPAVATMDHWQFCALIEHELSHIGQATDKYGSPRFNDQTGKPTWEMRGHCVEEFTSIVRRYGATSPELAEMVRAVNKGPELSEANISRSCGTCLRLVR